MNSNSFFDSYWRNEDYQVVIKAYYYQEFKNYITPSNHSHNRAEIMYVVKGDCEVIFEEESVPMKNGDFIFIDADVKHQLKVGGEGSRLLNIEFLFMKKFCPFFTIGELTKYTPSLKNFFSIVRPYILLKDYEEKVEPLIGSLINELDNSGAGNDFTRQMKISELLINISDIYNQMSKVDSNSKEQYVISAQNFMHQYYDYDLSVSHISKIVNLNERYLQFIFKKQTGYTINGYLTQIRIDKAKQLLRYTNIEISKICEYIGMNSEQYFSYLFKKHVGLSPREYRKEEIRLEAETEAETEADCKNITP